MTERNKYAKIKLQHYMQKGKGLIRNIEQNKDYEV